MKTAMKQILEYAAGHRDGVCVLRRCLLVFSVSALFGWAGANAINPVLAQSAAYKVAVKSVRITPPKPRPGQTVSVIMTVTTSGRGKKSVPWEILLNNKKIGGGVQRNVTAGRSFTVQVRWRAAAGTGRFTGRVDPRNTLREAGNDRRNNARTQAIRVAAATATTRPGQKPVATSRANSSRNARNNTRGQKPASALSVKVSGFTISPSTPKFSQNANLRFRIKVDGTGTGDVDWVLKRGNSTIGTGTQRNARAGQTYTVNKSWRATIGNHRFGVALDPNRKLGEKSSMRGDNVKFINVAVAAPNWAKCGAGAFTGAVASVRSWQAQARFRNIKVVGPSAIGTPGVLTGPSISPAIEASMLSEGCPSDISDKFAAAVGKAWQDWQNRVMIPGLPWYPAFAAFPGPSAPPMQNVPVPLAALPSSGADLLTANSLKSALNARLSAVKSQPGAQAAIQNFSTKFAARFTAWRAQQLVVNVLGRGRVPNFAPPLVPVGPVVNGTASSSPGAALRSKPF